MTTGITFLVFFFPAIFISIGTFIWSDSENQELIKRMRAERFLYIASIFPILSAFLSMFLVLLQNLLRGKNSILYLLCYIPGYIFYAIFVYIYFLAKHKQTIRDRQQVNLSKDKLENFKVDAKYKRGKFWIMASKKRLHR